jgi:hypothetical protein
MEREQDRRAAIVCAEVASGRLPILRAERSEPGEEVDSGWQFLCGDCSEDWRRAQVWAVHEVLALEPSLTTFIEFPTGTRFVRRSQKDDWEVTNAEPD